MGYLGTLGYRHVAVPGTMLCDEDRKHVLAAYVHRYTGEHVPEWVRAAGQLYPVQFKDDLDWLAHSYFAVRRDGRLDERVKHCESHPTWPFGKEIKSK